MKIDVRIDTYIYIFFIIFFTNCTSRSNKVKEIDFSEAYHDTINQSDKDTLQTITVAVSAMISPNETFTFYQDLLNYMAEKLQRSIEFKQRKTYREVNDLLISNQVDIAFICSGAYVEDDDNLDLLVAPLCNNQPYYQAYIVVHEESPIKKFEDLENKSFAYTDLISNTGKLYAEKRVHELNSTSDIFFSNVVYSHAHDISIQLVANKVVHGATVHSLIFDYMKKYTPEKVENLKIIERSELFGIPPVVASKRINNTFKKQIREMFLDIHNDSIGQIILSKLLINKFVIVDDTLYNSIRIAHEVIEK